MSFPSLTNDDIKKATRRDDLIREAAQQIIKDFAEFGLEIQFSGDVTQFYDELFAQMHGYVIALLETSQSKFFNLLYRIDVSPTDIQKYEVERPEAAWSELTTELIIFRELKKVMIRDYFRTHG